MAGKLRKITGYHVFIAVLIVLLLLAVALFIYGSVSNGMIRPSVPGKGIFALGTILLHG